MSDTDLQLLDRYARQHAEDAFAELVRRHLDLVHSAALRQVRSHQLAEEVAQSAFTDLARNATKLKPDTILTAWLYQVACRTAIDVVRREARRQLREQVATELNAMNATTTDWTHIEPLLDEAMSALDETDRAAVLLRYFENKSLREVGQTLGTSDDAAQKRVSRAVEHLREFLTKRGVTVGTGGLAAIISTNAVQAAPVGLVATISAAAAFAGTTLAATTTATATKAIAMTALQKTIITATIAAAVGTGIYEARQASQLRNQVRTLEQQQAPLTSQIQKLTHERDDAVRQLAALREDNERLNRNTGELLKLRGEVGPLKQASTVLSNQVAHASNPYGLLPEQMPPVIASSVPDTANAYARLVKKLGEGQLSAAEELNLLKAWPYLERRFGEPDSFSYFQSEYLASMFNVTDKDKVWAIRRLLEHAREEEHANGLRWARESDEELQRYRNLNLDIQKIREQWNAINQKATEGVIELLPEDQQPKLRATSRQVLDFDPRLKVGGEASSSNPRFQNLSPQEVLQSFFPANLGVRVVPATPLEKH